MDVTNVMDDHAESERSSIGIHGEALRDLLIVVGGQVIFTWALEPLGQIGEGTNDIVFGHLVKGVLVHGVTVDNEGLIDEVPIGLEIVDRLDIVSEGSALREGVINLAFNKVGARHLEGVKLGESCVENSGIFGFEEGLSLCGN
jgi:hypothetical protein